MGSIKHPHIPKKQQMQIKFILYQFVNAVWFGGILNQILCLNLILYAPKVNQLFLAA